MGKAKVVHTLLWRMIQGTSAVYHRFYFRVSVRFKAKPPKGNYLLVANHATSHDPFLIGSNLRTPINYMANIDGVKGFRKLFSASIGCFNIKKGRADFSAFAKAIKLIKEGYSVGIFPEGDRSWLGETHEFSSATASLAKRMNVPVLMARITGHYFSQPRWSPNIPRRGKIVIEFDLIPVEELAHMSKEQIHEKISAYIYSDDFTDPRLADVQFTGKDLALGIEHILWKCPSCNADDALVGEGDLICCKSCGAVFPIDGNQRVQAAGDLTTVKAWSQWQRALMKENLTSLASAILLQDDEVEFIKEDGPNNWVSLGKGLIQLHAEGIRWKANDAEDGLFFSLAETINVVDNFNQYALLNLKQSRYRMVFNKTCSYKWTTALELLKAP